MVKHVAQRLAQRREWLCSLILEWQSLEQVVQMKADGRQADTTRAFLAIRLTNAITLDASSAQVVPSLMS